MVIGAGMYVVGIGSVILVEVVQVTLYHDLPVYRHSIVAEVKCVLNDPDRDYDKLVERLKSYDAKISSIKWDKKEGESSVLQCSITFGSKYDRDNIIDILNGIEEVIRFELP
jgi:hypothetical protein